MAFDSRESSGRTTPTICKCWGFSKRFGLNIYGRAFWQRGPHVRWMLMWWAPGVKARWGNSDLDFEPVKPGEVLLIGDYPIFPAEGHDHDDSREQENPDQSNGR